jgi:integrase
MGTISRYVSKSGDVSFNSKVRRKGFPTQSKTFTNRRDAEKWMRAVERSLDLGEIPSDQSGGVSPSAGPDSKAGGRTIADVLRARNTEARPIERILCNRWLTKDEYRDWIGMKADAAALRWFRAHEEARGLSASAIRRMFGLIVAAIRADGLAVEFKRPKEAPHRERVATPGEIDTLTRAASPDMKRVILFALATAMRQGEIAALTYADVDKARKVAKIRRAKTGPRECPLSAKALAAIGPCEGRAGLVFGLSAESIKRMWIRLCKRCKVYGLRFHDLRHSALTAYAKAGLNPLQLAVISGHKDIKMLSVYTHLRAADVAAMI